MFTCCAEGGSCDAEVGHVMQRGGSCDAEVGHVMQRWVHFGTNFRAVINGWNVTTSLWLRRVCYDRVPPSFVISPTMTVWLVSAMWHGFYPSYYLTFVCCGFITEAARKMRRLLNHHFQTDPVRKRLYDVATVATTLFFTDFAAICFQLLFLHKCLRLWSYFYYAPFVVVVLISVIPIPGDHKIARKSTKQSKVRVREHRKIKKYTRRQMLLYRHRHSHAPCTDNGVEM
eukprot:Em0005g1557a